MIGFKPNASELIDTAGRALGTARRGSRCRGVAMLMVLAVLAAVTIVTASAITAHQSAPEVGVNALSQVQAKWSAESAAGIAVAVLETSYDFSGANALMMNGASVANGAVTVTLTTPSGGTPTAQDRELLLTATSVVGGVTRTVRKLVSVTTAAGVKDSVDPYYNEFGIVAADSLSVGPGSVVTKWPLSPEYGVAKPVGIAATTSSGSKVSVDSSASVRDAALYASAVADSALTGEVASPKLAAGGTKIPYVLPVAHELRPSAFTTLPVATASDLDVVGISQNIMLPTGGSYASLQVRGKAAVTLSATKGTHYSFEDLSVRDSGVLRIQGTVLVETRGTLRVEDMGDIILADNASGVAFFTRDDVIINDAAVGAPIEAARDTTRSLKYIDSYTRPDSIRFFSQPPSTGGVASPAYTLSSNSLVLACIHAPNAGVTMSGASTVVGKVVGHAVNLASGASLYYDPCLDPRTGFSALKGPLYDASGEPLPELATTLASFNTLTGISGLKASILSLSVLDDSILETAVAATPTTGPAPTERDKRLTDVRAVAPDKEL